MNVSKLFVALLASCALYISLVSLIQLSFNHKVLSLADWGLAPHNVSPSEWEGPTPASTGARNRLMLKVIQRSEMPKGPGDHDGSKGSSPQERSMVQRDAIKCLEYRNETRWSQVRFVPILSDVFVFAVFHDQRQATSSYVRIFVLQKRDRPTVGLTCGFDGVTGTVRADVHEMCENHDKKYGGWVYSCLVPDMAAPRLADVVVHVVRDDGRLLVSLRFDVIAIVVQEASRPSGVSHISQTDNDISNTDIRGDKFIKIALANHRNHETHVSEEASHKKNSTNFKTQEDFPRDIKPVNVTLGVCVPPLHGHLSIEALVTFIEFSRTLGAGAVFFYTHNMPEDFLEVLRTYMNAAESNILSLVNWPLPAQASGFQNIWNHGQILAVQHCLYTNMAHFDWLLFMDIDEMLIPRKVDTWQDMIQMAVSTHKTTSNHSNIAAISFPSAYFQQNLQTFAASNIKYFSQLYRTVDTDLKRSKVLVDPKQLLELGIHHVSRAISEGAGVIEAPSQLGLLHHYRQCTEDAHLRCAILQEDLGILRYEARVTNASRFIMVNGNNKAVWEHIQR